MRRPNARYPTKAALTRLVNNVRAAGLNVDQFIIEVAFDGEIRFVPTAIAKPTIAEDTWADL